ncbi:ATPase [Mycolicibacterium sp. HK-90]|uniref:ATPase n=1 Tax=Mycolicibacterium sp. HK-90 TaxID=3056937 RepID=UPI0026595B71|nr:ATPase [Mycolicibacterium sp. HK-90]WKG06741.1 ATPase [Mycolicibacterium sp. HK-90]
MSLVLCGLAAAPPSAWPEPGSNCPPLCDRIPDSAWIAPAQLPLAREYRWPGLAGLAVTAVAPRFRFEDECAVPPVPGDPRSYAVAARADVGQPPGHWQLRVQVIHWRGETWQGGQTAMAVVQGAVGALRDCLPNPPTITTDRPGRLAAVLDLGDGRVLHQYLVADPRNSTVVELAMWSTVPPQVAWAAPSDRRVLDALEAPLCTAYIGSCR